MTLAQSLLKNALAGARLAFMLRARPEAFRVSLDQVAILMGLGIALQFAVVFLLTEAPRAFNADVVPNWGFSSFIVLVSAYLAALLMGAPGRTAQLLVVLASISLWTDSIGYAIVTVIGEKPAADSMLAVQIAFVAILIWSLAVTFRAIRAVWPAQLGRGLLGVVLLYGLTLGAGIGFPSGLPWYTAHDDQEAAYAERFKWIPVEETYRAQRGILAQAGETLAPQRAGVTDLYFLGFGGDAGQDVFMREVLSVRELFDERFDTQNRSLALINNRATLETVPIASLTNLEDGLSVIGDLIDPEEDVVFVYLTSHGSIDHQLSADFWPLGLSDITPGALNSALDQAGIEWRVIVVSACYSGGFIEPLRNEKSLIITAAQFDRTSFGCSNEAEFTFFGKAYFDQALRSGLSFVEAFSRARIAVGERELAEKYTPSEPQIHIGTKIEAKLARLEERLGRRQSASTRQKMPQLRSAKP